MGNCCAGNANEGEVHMMKGGHRLGAGALLDEREVAGLRGSDKIILIVKI